MKTLYKHYIYLIYFYGNLIYRIVMKKLLPENIYMFNI